MLKNATFYKTGLVVPDLAAAADRLDVVRDHDWRDLGENPPYEYWFADGIRALSLRSLVSGTTPHIHLFQELPNTLWKSSESGATHHVAYWVDGIADATRQMLAAGFTVESRDAGDPDLPQHWAYFIDPSGIRVELLDRFGAAEPTAFIADLPRWRD